MDDLQKDLAASVAWSFQALLAAAAFCAITAAERFFNKLKHFRRIATRYNRRKIYVLAAIQLASSIIWMR